MPWLLDICSVLIQCSDIQILVVRQGGSQLFHPPSTVVYWRQQFESLLLFEASQCETVNATFPESSWLLGFVSRLNRFYSVPYHDQIHNVCLIQSFYQLHAIWDTWWYLNLQLSQEFGAPWPSFTDLCWNMQCRWDATTALRYLFHVLN